MELMKETELIDTLRGRFPELAEAGEIHRVRSVFMEVPQPLLMQILRYAKLDLHFGQLCTITGLDAVDHFEVLYHISRDDGMVLSLKIKVDREHPSIESVLPIYNGATFYEREVEGMLGIPVEGLPPGRQYPLPDNWPEGEYPLRKDWTADRLSQNK